MSPELAHCNLEGLCLCYTVAVENDTTLIKTRDEACEALGKALRRNHSLQYLLFAGNNLHPNGAHALMTALTDRPNMSQLVLIGNKSIGYEGLKQLGEDLAHVTLEELYLDSCVDTVAKTSPTGAQSEACQALAHGLRRNNVLKDLDLANNGIDSMGAQLLIQAIAYHPSLIKLSLAGNPEMGYTGLQLIAQELPRLRLEGLKLGGCVNSSTATDALIKKTGQALLEGVKENVYLLELDLEQADLSDDCLDEIDFYLEVNNSGRNLIHKSDTFAPTLWCHILANADEEVGHIYYFLREQPWLVRPTGNRPQKRRKAQNDAA